MKASTFLLLGSLAANVVFAAVFFAGRWAARLSSSSTVIASTPPAAAAGAVAAASSGAVIAVDPETWAHLQTGDLPAFLARLRAEGFPPDMVRALVADQIRAQFAPRRAALNAASADRPFWEPAGNQDPKTAVALREIQKEQERALKDLMGPDPTSQEYLAATLHRQFPGLSDGKLDQLLHIQQDYDEKRSDLNNLLLATGGTVASDYEAKRQELEKAQHAAIAETLTPQELEDYDLRASTTANSLRSQLTAFDTTEQEFRALFAIRQSYEDRLGPLLIGANGPPSQEELRARSDAQRQQTEDIKAALGDERYADYQRATDGNYRQTSQLVTRLGLPPETTNAIYAVQQDAQQRARAIQTNRALAPDDRTQQLAALADEARAKVTGTLGENGFEAYKQYGGAWLQNLQPRPAPTAPGAAAPSGGGGGVIFR